MLMPLSIEELLNLTSLIVLQPCSEVLKATRVVIRRCCDTVISFGRCDATTKLERVGKLGVENDVLLLQLLCNPEGAGSQGSGRW
jgi:hypothetical protein